MTLNFHIPAIIVKPDKLAEAGFFHYDQRGDTVACYVCAARVRHWQGEHDPWIAHYAANKFCELIHSKKSPEWFKNAAQITLVVPKSEYLSDYFNTSASPSNATIRNGFVVQKSAENSSMFLKTAEQSNEAKFNGDNTCLNNEFMCAICLTSKVEILFQPCMHIASCTKCCFMVTSCCICRQKIVKYERVFFA